MNYFENNNEEEKGKELLCQEEEKNGGADNLAGEKYQEDNMENYSENDIYD